MITAVKCDLCNEWFNVEHEEGETRRATMPCPHCGIDTTVHIGQQTAIRAAPPLPESEPPPIRRPIPAPPSIPDYERVPKRSYSIAPLVCIIFGVILSAVGCLAEVESKNGINQTYAAIQYCTGFIIIAIGSVASAIINR